jgi:uncharacterized membrane protein YfcA
MGYGSLQQCVNDLEQHGHLVRIREEVDPHLEMAAIHLRVYAHNGPALLFENVEGSELPLVIGVYGTRQRMAWALGLEDLDELGARLRDLIDVKVGGGLVGLASNLPKLRELAALPPQRLKQETLIAAVGGVLGALLLLVTPAAVFKGLVPWLLLFATVLFVLGPRVAQLREASGACEQASPLKRHIGLLAVAIYGGYFNGGLGILLLALYTVCGEKQLSTSNALKNLNSLVLSLLSVATFAVAGAIAWGPALVMMVAATLGGYSGAHVSKNIPVAWVRGTVVVTGLVMSLVFFVRS